MRRLLFLVVLGILAMDASGLDALLVNEPCTTVEDAKPDGTCPALCVRCACCAQPIVPEFAVAIVSELVPSVFVDRYSPGIPRTAPSKIFHVPKFASPTI